MYVAAQELRHVSRPNVGFHLNFAAYSPTWKAFTGAEKFGLVQTLSLN